MGVALSKNSADMVANIWNNSVATTNVKNTNQTSQGQTAIMNNCDIFTEGGNANLSQNATQVLNIQQFTTNQNQQQTTNLVNQKLLQQAQSSLSNFGVGVASAINNMSIATNVTNSMQVQMNTANTNVNNSMQTFVCNDSVIDTGGGNLDKSQLSNQNIISAQTTSSDSWQSITNTISQSAQQTATATVAGFSFGTILIAILGVVLLIVLARAFAGMSQKKKQNNNETSAKSKPGKTGKTGEPGKTANLGGGKKDKEKS